MDVPWEDFPYHGSPMGDPSKCHKSPMKNTPLESHGNLGSGINQRDFHGSLAGVQCEVSQT